MRLSKALVLPGHRIKPKQRKKAQVRPTEERVTGARSRVDSGSEDGSEEKGGHKLSSEHDNQIF